MNYHILGSSGFAREVAGIIDAHLETSTMFEDGEISAIQQALIADWEGVTYIGVGSPKLKEKWAKELKETTLKTPQLIDKNAIFRDYNNSTTIGKGSIICAGTVITTNVKIGEFVTINLNCTIGHDSSIGDFSTLAPGCNISGNVHVGKLCDIGSNVTIIPGVTLPDGGIVGAGSVVIKTPKVNELWVKHNFYTKLKDFNPNVESYVMVGSPARVVKINGVRVDDN